MIVQGLVDANYCFLDVCIGWPGSVHDARVFAHSNLYKKGTHGHLIPNKSITISGVHVPLYMKRDSAYPLHDYNQLKTGHAISCCKLHGSSCTPPAALVYYLRSIYLLT